MAAGMEFVPMQWGRWGIWGLDRRVGLLSPRPAALLGFNEPTHVQQVLSISLTCGRELGCVMLLHCTDPEALLDLRRHGAWRRPRRATATLLQGARCPAT